MQIVENLMKYIQHNPWAYIAISALVSVFLTLIKDNSIKKVNSNPARERRKKNFWTFLISFAVEMGLLTVSIFYPYVDDEEMITPDGNLKLSFFNGAFSYRTSEDPEFNDENDIVNPQNYAYLNRPVSPVVYITIADLNGVIITETKSEYVSECIIPLKYGDYILTTSCDNHIDHTTEISLRPDNKKANVWNHKVYLIPDLLIARDVRVQVADSNGNPLPNTKVEIGCSGHMLVDKTDSNGFLCYKFTLTKGEYDILLSDQDLLGHFVINESTSDNQVFTVLLMPI